MPSPLVAAKIPSPHFSWTSARILFFDNALGATKQLQFFVPFFMVRQSQIQFTIPQPCNIPWNEMQPVDTNQRHCSSCDRVITDFSKMSDDELMLYFRHNNEKMCGRFSVHQINRPFQLIPEKYTKAKWWRTVFLFPLLLFGKSGKAQNDSVKISHTDSIALSKNSKEKLDTIDKKIAVVKNKKHHHKPKLIASCDSILIDSSIVTGIIVQTIPEIVDIDFPILSPGKSKIEKQDPYRDLTDKKEEPKKPQEPALPSSDPLAGILPEQRKNPWRT